MRHLGWTTGRATGGATANLGTIHKVFAWRGRGSLIPKFKTFGFTLPWLHFNMAEDTNEKVLHDLDLMEISDLRLMARQNDLRFDGTRAELLSRIKAEFGFENEKMYIEESSQQDEEGVSYQIVSNRASAKGQKSQKHFS